jgi:FdhD protein
MRTPGADRELAAGFLLSEGIVHDSADIGAVDVCRHPDHPDVHNVVNVFLLGPARERLDASLAARRNVTATSSCGICGRVTIETLAIRAHRLVESCRVHRDAVLRLPDSLRGRQAAFETTGGLHGAALFSPDGALVNDAEDVGRHNAVDKTIGAMLLDERLPLTGLGLVVSGRASYEIVQKAWIAEIEIVCAVSAPSSLAIELADEAGITLIGFARESGFNVYTHHGRVRL